MDPLTVGGEEADTRFHKPRITNYLTYILKTVADDYLRRTAITRPIFTDKPRATVRGAVDVCS